MGWLDDFLDQDFGVATSGIRSIGEQVGKWFGGETAGGGGHSSAPRTSSGIMGLPGSVQDLNDFAYRAFKDRQMGIGNLLLDDYSIPANDFGGFNTTVSGRRGLMPYTGGLIPSGYRVANRPATRGTPGRPAGTYLVPRRSMNPLNPRALMRAERRMSAFTRWVSRHFAIAKRAPRRKKVGRKRR